MSDDTYFFEVSVAEHPQSKKRMNDLAKSVIEAQTEMTKAVSMVGDAASASFKNIGSLLDGIESLRSGGVGALRAIQAEVRALQELSRQKITLAVQVERQDSGAKAAGVTEADAPPSRAIGGGVAERDPRTYTDALQANQVEERRILQQRIKDQSAANAVIKAGIESVGDSFDALRARASKTIVQEVDLRPLLTDAAKPIVQKVDVVADDDLEKIRSEAAKPIVQKIDVVTTQSATGSLDGFDIDAYTENLRDSQGEEQAIWARKVQDQADANAKIKAGIGSVGDSLDELRNDASAPIVQTVQVKTTQAGQAAPPFPPSPNGPNPSDYTDELHDSMVKEKAIYEQKVNDQKTAFEKASSEYDKAIATQHKSADEMNKAALKGARGVIDAAKGWAQLGLVGEENAKKLVEGLVMIEGAFNIAKGGVEFLEAFGQGWKAVKNSQAAANNVAKITASLRSAEFAQLRAYHIALVQEAEAASLAAGANGRLAASRTAAGMAAGTGAAAAVGAATSVGAGAVGALAGAGGTAVAAGGLAGVGAMVTGAVGTLATGATAMLGAIVTPFTAGLAAAGASLAVLAGAVIEVKDQLNGVAGTVGSTSGAIAEFEAGTAAWALSFTGLFTSLDAPSTKLAQSMTAQIDAVVKSIPIIGQWSDRINGSLGGLGDYVTLLASQNELKKAENRSVLHKINQEKIDAEENIRRDIKDAMTRASFDNRNQIRSIDAGDNKEGQLSAAIQKKLDAARLLAEYSAKMVELEQQNLDGTEDHLDAERQVIQYRKDLLDATAEQGRLEADVAKSAIDNHKKEQDAIKDKMKEAKKGLEDLEKSQQSAVENFAKLDKVQQVTAIKALEKARGAGGASLSDKEKDLLRSVGTDEAKMLASEGDKAEANAVGFDRTFGSGFEAERQAMDSMQKQLEAEFKTTYDITVKTENDYEALSEQVKEAAKQAVGEKETKEKEVIMRAMNEGLAGVMRDVDQKLRTRNKNQ
jgi:hypothetical protein